MYKFKHNIKLETELSQIREIEEYSYDELSDIKLDDSESFISGNSWLDTEDDSKIIKKDEKKDKKDDEKNDESRKNHKKDESRINKEDESDTDMLMNLIICLSIFPIIGSQFFFADMDMYE